MKFKEMVIPKQSNSKYWGRRHKKYNYKSYEFIPNIVNGVFRYENLLGNLYVDYNNQQIDKLIYPDASLSFKWNLDKGLSVQIPDEFSSDYSFRINDEGYLIINKK